MAMTPNDVSVDLLRILRDAVREMSHNVPIDSETLLLGIADMLGELCSATPEYVQHRIVAACLERFVNRVPGGKLVVVRTKPAGGNGEDGS